MTDTAPSTTDCELCALAKAKQIVSRRATHQEEVTEAFERVAFDLIPMEKAQDGKEWCSHLICLKTKYTLVKNHKSKGQAVHVLEEFILVARVWFKRKVIFIKIDDEQALGGYYEDMKSIYGFTSERNAPYSSQQAGAFEKSGDVIITKAVL